MYFVQKKTEMVITYTVTLLPVHLWNDWLYVAWVVKR